MWLSAQTRALPKCTLDIFTLKLSNSLNTARRHHKNTEFALDKTFLEWLVFTLFALPVTKCLSWKCVVSWSMAEHLASQVLEPNKLVVSPKALPYVLGDYLFSAHQGHTRIVFKMETSCCCVCFAFSSLLFHFVHPALLLLSHDKACSYCNVRVEHQKFDLQIWFHSRFVRD